MIKRVAIFLLVLLSAFVRAQDAKPPISYALYELGYLYSDSAKAGIDLDIVRELTRRSGREFTTVYLPRARIWHELETGSLMMTGSGIQTPERDAFAWFIPCLGLKNYVVTSAADAHTRPGDFRSNPELLFGVVRAFRHGPAADAYIDDLRSDGRVTEVADSEFLYKMLLAGRFHAFMALLPSIEFYIDQYKLQDKLAVSDWFPDDPPIVHYLVFSKKAFSEADMSEWRTLVAEMIADGTLEHIYATYLGAQNARVMIDTLR